MPKPWKIVTDPLTQVQSMYCTKCAELKEMDQFYTKMTGSKIIYGSWCRSCVKEYRQTRIDKRIVVNPSNGYQEIMCPSCKERKPVNEFYAENYIFSKNCKRCTRLAA